MTKLQQKKKIFLIYQNNDNKIHKGLQRELRKIYQGKPLSEFNHSNRIMRILLFFLLLSMICLKVQSQIDSTRQNHRMIFSLDSRNSYIKGQKAAINGIKFGIKENRFATGIGAYGLSKPIKREGTFESLSSKTIEGKVELYFDYYTFWIDYAWIETKRWELTSAYHLGIGKIEILYYPYDLSIIRPHRKAIGVTELFISVVYKVHRYLGFGVGSGIRNLISLNKIVIKNFDSPLYQFRIKLYTSEIFKDIKGLVNKKYKK